MAYDILMISFKKKKTCYSLWFRKKAYDVLVISSKKSLVISSWYLQNACDIISDIKKTYKINNFKKKCPNKITKKTCEILVIFWNGIWYLDDIVKRRVISQRYRKNAYGIIFMIS
jgi:hypothetical protein